MFPAPHKNASEGELNVVTIGFQDKISVMVSKKGKTSNMYYVPLQAAVSGSHEIDNSDEIDLFPLPHLTPTPLVGGLSDDIQGRLYATQIASVISRQSPEETRTVVVGLAADIGPRPDQEITKQHRQELLTIIKLVQECRVW